MSFTIKTKIFLTVFTISLIFVLITFFTINRFLSQIADDEITHNLRSARFAYKRSDTLHIDLLINHARSIAQAPHLKAVMNIPGVDHETVYYTARGLFEAGKMDLMLLIDSEGKLIADIGAPAYFNQNMRSYPGVTEGLSGKEYSGIYQYREQLYRIALTPIVMDRQLLGLLVIGESINNETMNEIGQFTGTGVLLFYSDQLISQSDAKSDVPAISQDEITYLSSHVTELFTNKDQLSSIFPITLRGKRCLAMAIPLHDNNGYAVLYRYLEDIESSVAMVRFLFIGGGILGVFSAILFSLWLSSLISKPILALRDAAEQFGAGHFETRVAVSSKDELGQLSKAFNIMAEDIKTARQDLESERDYVSNILRSMIDMVIVLNPDGIIRTVNPATLQLLGYSESEIINHPLKSFIDSNKNSVSNRQFEDIWKEMFEKHFIRNVEGIFLTKNNQEIPVMFSGSILEEDQNQIQGIALVAQDITERKRAEKLIKDSQKQLQALSLHIQRMQEEERTRISREIHDELGQSLTGIKMDLVWLKDEMSLRQKPLIDKLIKFIDTTMNTVQRISTQLRPVILDDLGLVAAIEWQIQDFQNRSGINCELNFETEDISIDQDRSTAIFRILQEALTNILRHAEANEVIVNLEQREKTLLMSVIDDGKGIYKEQITDRNSLGILGMKERLQPWGGEFQISKMNGSGTKLMVQLPLDT
ncbi:MAG: PAS domain S-box protein [Candidatus Marinimicrobia bacterium]|nr:PAS domain S-box protein [Candidatus Neomarinimicrobiota bacterium]